jgi:prepilin-type N-terminal cleavage/methylation domain-containing protein
MISILQSRGERQRDAGGARGFTLVEMVIVVTVALILSAMAVVQLWPMLQQNQANAAMAQLLGQLRGARETAISQRRSIQVQFLGNNTIQLTRMNMPAGTTVLSTLALEGTVQFMLLPGMPDTPDNFGIKGPIEFAGLVGGPVTMMFQSDGTFVGPTGTPINGTVFLGVTGLATSARAVTVMGATGRVRGYRSTGAGWLK